MNRCFQCSKPIQIADKLGFREVCPSCQADLHCCKACKFYESTAYNECYEPNAERILDKLKANFCEYFELNTKKTLTEVDEKQKALEALKALFK